MSAGGFGRANLPYGIFRRAGEPARVGVRFGDGVLDLAALAADGLLDDPGGGVRPGRR
jgi:fumarylacetoacetase